MKGVQCYELLGGIALKTQAFLLCEDLIYDFKPQFNFKNSNLLDANVLDESLFLVYNE